MNEAPRAIFFAATTSKHNAFNKNSFDLATREIP